MKFQLYFAKEPCKRDDILQKRPMILRSLLIVATPYPCPTWRRNNKYQTLGWLQSVGSIKLQVPFAKYCLFYRVLLQKRRIIFLPHVGQKNIKNIILNRLSIFVWILIVELFYVCQCVAVCSRVLQYVEGVCSVLRRIAVWVVGVYGVKLCIVSDY